MNKNNAQHQEKIAAGINVHDGRLSRGYMTTHRLLGGIFLSLAVASASAQTPDIRIVLLGTGTPIPSIVEAAERGD